MKIVPFPRRSARDGAPSWQSAEVQSVADACAPSLSRGEISGWEIGATEAGDPQLYLLGPAPDFECVLCISRIGRLYVLEDGNGHVVFEHDAMSMLADQVSGTLRRKKAAIVARATLAWISVKAAFEERVEPLLAEPTELLSHIAPQIVALV